MTIQLGKAAWLSRPAGPLSWSALRKLTNSKPAQHVFVFLFLTPLLATILERVLKPESAVAAQPLAVGLPLNWTLCFFAACAFLLGQVIVTLRCPILVGTFPDYGAFIASARPLPSLWAYFETLPRSARAQVSEQLRLGDVAAVSEEPAGTITFMQMKRPNEKHAADVVFHELSMAAERARPVSRLLTAISCAAGLSLFAAVLVHNIFVATMFYAQHGL